MSDVIIKGDGYIVGVKREHNATRTTSHQWIDIVFAMTTGPALVKIELPIHEWLKWERRFHFRRNEPDFEITMRSTWPEDSE